MPAHADLTTEDRRCLELVAKMMIPACDGYAVPGADDPVIFADILTTAESQSSSIVEALKIFNDLTDTRYSKTLAELDETERAFMLSDFGASRAPEVCLLLSVVLQCYYRDDRVLSALGQPTRAPFPQGYVVEQGDWSLLDPVKQRAKFYREV